MADWDYEMVWSGDGGLSGVRNEVRELAAEGWEVLSTCAVTGVFVVVLRRRAAGARGTTEEAAIDLTAGDRLEPEPDGGRRRPRSGSASRDARGD